MGGACRAHGGGGMCTELLLESLDGGGHSEDVGIDGWTILKRILGK
jgi:hypothetical protein